MVVRNRQSLLYPLPIRHYEYLEELVYTPLKYKENSILMMPPLYGRDHEVNNLIGRSNERSKLLLNNLGDYRIGFVHLASTQQSTDSIWLEQMERALGIAKGVIDQFEDFALDINNLLQELNHIAFFINIPETLPDEAFTKFLFLAQKTYYIAPTKIHFILIFDMRWEEETFYRLTAPFRSLFQNAKLLSLFSDKEVGYFVQYYCTQWNLTIPISIKDYIIEQSGGILLLAKSALRVIRNEKIKKLDEFQNVIMSHADHQLQINFFLSRLTERQQSILKLLANGESSSDPEISHLERMGIILGTSEGKCIRSKFLHHYLEDRASPRKKTKIIQASKELSEREKQILFHLIKKPGVIVSRDAIAKILWGNQSYELYSDWAIDQTISRIRKKLLLIPSLSGSRIETHKKLGFSFR